MKPGDFNRAVMALVEFTTIANTYIERIAEILAKPDGAPEDAEIDGARLGELIEGARHDLQLAGHHAEAVAAVLRAANDLSKGGPVQ